MHCALVAPGARSISSKGITANSVADFFVCALAMEFPLALLFSLKVPWLHIQVSQACKTCTLHMMMIVIGMCMLSLGSLPFRM